MADRWGNSGNSGWLYFLGLQNHSRQSLRPKTLDPWKKRYDKPRQCNKKQRHHFADKGPSSQSYGFSSNCVRMWELDHKEGWVLKNGYFWIVMLEKTLESTLDCKEIKPVKSKGNQPWTFTGRTVAKAEAPILWPPDVNSQLTRQLLMLGKTEDKRRRK